MRHLILCLSLLCACTDEVPAQLQHDATVDSSAIVDSSIDVADAQALDAPASIDASLADGGFDAQ